MGTVRPPAALGSLVDLNVLDNEAVNVETLELGVALGVFQETEHEFSALDGPPGLRHAVGLGLRRPAHTSVVATERNSLLVLLHILKEREGLFQLQALNGLGRLPRVLEVNLSTREWSQQDKPPFPKGRFLLTRRYEPRAFATEIEGVGREAGKRSRQARQRLDAVHSQDKVGRFQFR